MTVVSPKGRLQRAHCCTFRPQTKASLHEIRCFFPTCVCTPLDRVPFLNACSGLFIAFILYLHGDREIKNDCNDLFTGPDFSIFMP